MLRALLCAVGICIALIPVLAWAADQPSRVEHSKSMPPPGNSLGSKFYEPTDAEKAATKEWKEDELASGSPEIESLKGALGRRIAWFGILREVTEDKQKDETALLIEMKFFDGLSDIHQQVVSISGAGDFRDDPRHRSQAQEACAGESLWQGGRPGWRSTRCVGRFRSQLGLGAVRLHVLRQRQ